MLPSTESGLSAGVAETPIDPAVENHQQVGDLSHTRQAIEEDYIVPHGTD